MQPSGQRSLIRTLSKPARGLAWLALATLGLVAFGSGPVAAGAAAVPGASKVVWLSSLAQARDESQRTGRPILVDFSATWCGPCQAMIHETFPDPVVAPILAKLICVRIDVDQDPGDAEHYQVSGIPRILLLGPNPSASPKMDLLGYEDAGSFASDLKVGLGMAPASESSESSHSVAPPSSAASTVAEALASNTYGKLKAQNKDVAAQGLRELIADAALPQDQQTVPIDIPTLARAGGDLSAALVQGMASAYLSDRAASYELYRKLARASGSGSAQLFDPWAPKSQRDAQLAAIKAHLMSGH